MYKRAVKSLIIFTLRTVTRSPTRQIRKDNGDLRTTDETNDSIDKGITVNKRYSVGNKKCNE